MTREREGVWLEEKIGKVVSNGSTLLLLRVTEVNLEVKLKLQWRYVGRMSELCRHHAVINNQSSSLTTSTYNRNKKQRFAWPILHLRQCSGKRYGPPNRSSSTYLIHVKRFRTYQNCKPTGETSATVETNRSSYRSFVVAD